MQPLQPCTQNYVLTFQEGINYNHLNEDANSIFWAFNIPSWLHPSYKVRILNRLEEPQTNTIIFVVTLDSTPALGIPKYITLYFFQVFRDNTGQRLEYYVQEQDGLLQRRNKFSVKLEKYPQRKMFTITITDHENFFCRTLKQVSDTLYLVKDHDKMAPNILEYNYIEPENIRFKRQLKRQHFHLAFQGGGAKGIAYIGAYKAIKIMLPNDIVTSVIGSSAGSMCALAIASGISPQQIRQLFSGMDQIPKDRLVKTEADITPQLIASTNRIKIRIRQFLHEYGLIPSTFCSYVSRVYLDDPEFMHTLLDYFLRDRLSLRDMLSLPEIEPVYVNRGECCGPQTPPYGYYEQERLINFYGLLEGKLMTGEKVLEITDTVIKKVLDRVKRQNPILFNKTFTANGTFVSTEVLAKTVTMFQFYQFTGVELTCTGTDLDSQVLRFFNQKTTPYLPLRMAVIMSASFPIAFEARRWKKQWGKYYIHHAMTRMEIDITGHQFSDGGILANLPVMYIDNQEMRPIIFSHMRTPSTKVYGFGLDEITELPSPQLQQIRREKLSALKCKVIKQTPVCGICCYTCCCVPPNQYFNSVSIASVDDIPLLGFIKKLLSTYRHANTNLVMEIFRKDIYHFGLLTTLSRSLNFSITPQLVTQYRNIRQSLALIARKLKSMNNQEYGMLRYFVVIEQRLPKMKTIDQIMQTKALFQLIFKLFTIFTLEEKKRISYVNERNFQRGMERAESDILYQKVITLMAAKIESLNFDLEAVGREDYFVNVNDFNRQLKKICAISKQLRMIDKTLSDPKNASIRNRLSTFLANFFSYYQQHFTDILSGLINDLDSRIKDLEYAVENGAKALKNSATIKQLDDFYQSFGYYELPEFIEFQKHYIALEQPLIKAKRIYKQQEPAILYYIEQKINRRTSPNIHVVLQGRGTIPQLNLQAFKTVRQYLRQIESQQQQEYLNRMASIIINDQSNQTKKTFEIADLFILVVARADLMLKLQEHMRKLQTLELIDLGYIKYQIPPHLQKALIQIREKRRRQRCRITNVTTSGLTILILLLTILGFENEKIEEEIRIVSQYLFWSPFRIERKFQTYSWAIPMRCRIRQLQDLMWEQRFQIFTAMQMSIKEQKLPLNFEALRQEFQMARDDVFESFREVLEYISKTEYNAAMQKDPRKYFCKKMSLNTGVKNYYQINRSVATATRAMVRSLTDIFEHQIKLAIFTSGNVWINDILEGFPDPNLHEWLWKGIIIQNLIETLEYKKHVIKIFKEKNIHPDIKLKDFYRVAPLKITLTFTAVDLTTNQFIFVNHHTHPEMPLRLALTAATSLPIIFPKVVIRPVYLNKINPSQAQRKLELLLEQSNDEHSKHLYTSGNLLDVLPLDLLTSHQTRKLYFGDRQFTFISFGNTLLQPNPKPTTFLRKFPRFCDYMNLLCTGISNGFRVQPGRIITDKTAIVNTYLNSHDNYIYQIYKGNLLRLPIRMGTLDFHKVGPGSQLAEQTMFETQLCTFEKFSSTRRTYIQFELNDNRLLVRMLSRDINNNDLLSKYRLEFKTLAAAGYEKLTKRAFEMDLELEKQLYLRFYFVENGQIVEREYFLDVMTLLDSYWKFKGTYMLEYIKVLNTYIPPMSQPKKITRSLVPGPPVDMLLVYSIVDVQRTGLYCEACCSPLAINKLYFTIDSSQSQCYHCKQVKQTRFICTNKQMRCSGIYCMLCCCKFYFKKEEHLMCRYGHVMEFRNHRVYRLISQQNIPFVRCSCCLQPTQDYYEDKECQTTVCLKCCSSFVDKIDGR